LDRVPPKANMEPQVRSGKGNTLDDLSQDLRSCLRSFNQHPGTSLAVILVLALAVGINGIFLSFADALLFSAPVGLANPERIVRIPNSWLLHFNQYISLKQNLRSISLTAQSSRMPLSWASETGLEPIEVRFVTHNYFSVLGTSPIFGRSFLPEEDGESGTTPVAILGNSFWRRRFGAEGTVLGRTMRISDRVYTIVGVAPEGFSGVDTDPVDVWLPVRPAIAGNDNLWLLGRLADGRSFDQARAELLVRYPADVPIMRDVNTGQTGVQLTPIVEDLTTRLTKLHPMAVCMVGAGTALLLIACANVAGLLLNRALHRRHEIAARLQLGATRHRIMKQLWTEIVLLAGTCAVVALVVVHWGAPLLQRTMVAPIPGLGVLSPFPKAFFTLELQRYADGVLNVRMLCVIAFTALVASVLSSCAPLLYTLRVHASESMRMQRGLDAHHARLRAVFLSLQVALTVILLVSAGLFTRSLWNVVNVRLGVDTDNAVIASVDLRGARFRGSESKRILEDMRDSVRALPGVTHTSLSFSIPVGGVTKFYTGLAIPGREWPYGRNMPAGNARAFVNAVSPEYFDMLGMRILQGRGLIDSDSSTNPLVVIIDEKLARDLFQGESPLGHCVMFYSSKTPECRRIVGVVSSVRNDVVRLPGLDDDEEDPALYVAADQWSASRYVLIRTRNDPGPMMSMIRARLQAAASNLSYVKLERLSLYRDQQIHGWRIGGALLGAFGILALALAGVGIYAVLALVVKQRTQEIGIRLAIGGTPTDILKLSLRTGMTPVFIGIVIGVAGGMAIGVLMASLLFGVTAVDPLVLMGAGVLPIFVGAIACVVPCRRAIRIDPAISLRYE
jgi:putative ABC transport system permease protein